MNDPGDSYRPPVFITDLMKLIGETGAGSSWLEIARSMAYRIATDGEPEPNPDPVQRIRLAELARVAELHVAQATGLPLVEQGARPVAIATVGRGAWALGALDNYRPLIERFVQNQPGAAGAETAGEPATALTSLGRLNDEEGMQALLGQISSLFGPMFVGLQFGSALGHLARRAPGQYALPIPWSDSGDLLVVPQNIAAFAGDWSLPEDQTELWVCVRELTAHAVLSRPHVAAAVNSLLEAAIDEAAQAPEELMDRFAEPDALQQLMNDPESLLADLMAPGQRNTSAPLTAVTAAIGGYVDHVTSKVTALLTGSSAALTEAWRRYRISEDTDDPGEQAAGELFGLDLGREQIDRGAAFIDGVVERAGEEALTRLWEKERNLPTPADVDAPGLWLERIDLPDPELDA